MSNSNIFVAGYQGLVGSAIMRNFHLLGLNNIITVGCSKLNLMDQSAVNAFFANHSISQVYLCAGKVGGIHANSTYPAEFIYENLLIEVNVIHSAHMAVVQKLLFLGSSCIYPKISFQPMREEALLSGMLEYTNEPYAIAKIAGIKLCESYNRHYGRDYRSVMPTNLYGPNDNFHPQNSHVIHALMRRFHEAVHRGGKEIIIWGRGSPLREFMHVDEMAAACVHVMNLDEEIYRSHTQPMLSHVNVGTGVDCTIRELAETMAKVTGFSGNLVFDSTKPDGAPRKLLDVSRLTALGWRAKTPLEEGLRDTYAWFLSHQGVYRQ
jgi:GDP-L-fucose synthase